MKLDHALRVAHELTRYADGDCKTQRRSGYFVRQTFIDRATRVEERRAEERTEPKKTRRTKQIWVRLDKLRSNQRCLGRPRLIYQLQRYPLKKLPVVVSIGYGRFYLWDGNHRVSAAAMLGRARIKCVELYKMA